MNGSPKILNQIISNQRSTNDKTGIGYKAETSNPSTSKLFEETGKGQTNVKNTNMHMDSMKQEGN